MRHNVYGKKLGRTTAHRTALFRNQLASLVENERIRTTLDKAKALRPLAERVVTQSRRDSVHARRLVGRWLSSRTLIKKLFDEIGPRFVNRPGGYTRIVKLGPRKGDGAEMAILEFVERGEAPAALAARASAAKAAVRKPKARAGKASAAKPAAKETRRGRKKGS